MVKIAQISCGAEYSGVQKEIEEAAARFGSQIVIPEADLDYIDEAYEKFGFEIASSALKLMVARAMSVVDGKTDVNAVFIATCFRCAESALVRNEIRRFIQQNTNLPVVMYPFTERTKADELFMRMEALSTIVERKILLAREKQEGLTLGIDSGSTTTNVILMENNRIIGEGWLPTTDVVASAEEGIKKALQNTEYKLEDAEAIGVTGYGRLTVGKHFNADLIQEEISVTSKGAAFLADHQKGEATVLDIGGMDNKAITINDGIPDYFTMGGICAGASGRFLEITARRLGVDISELGALAVKGNHTNAPLDSYCIVFGIQDMVTSLAAGCTKEDIAAAACYSVAEQVYEQQLQEISVRKPVIQVGGTSLIEGVVVAVEDMLGLKVVVPENSQHVGGVGAALLASGLGASK